MAADEIRPDRPEVVSVVLDGLRSDIDLDELCDTVGRWHGPDSTFPADILLELAARMPSSLSDQIAPTDFS